MADTAKKYDTGIALPSGMKCARCDKELISRPVTLAYLGSSFPVDLPACPVCDMVFIPEDLAIGRMLHVEKTLEDK
jgi:hypothetical protein